MYHIKNDKRARASTELICAGLLACMKEKPFARITITDVQRASTVSRSTFYRNFDCLEDVLALLCDRGFQAVFSEYNALPPEQRGSLAKAVFHTGFATVRCSRRSCRSTGRTFCSTVCAAAPA